MQRTLTTTLESGKTFLGNCSRCVGKPEISGRQKLVLQVQDAANHLHMASEGLQPQPHGEERTFSSAAEVRSFNPRSSLIVSTPGDRLSQHSDGLPPKSKTGPGGAKEKDSGGPGQQQERQVPGAPTPTRGGRLLLLAVLEAHLRGLPHGDRQGRVQVRQIPGRVRCSLGQRRPTTSYSSSSGRMRYLPGLDVTIFYWQTGQQLRDKLDIFQQYKQEIKLSK